MNKLKYNKNNKIASYNKLNNKIQNNKYYSKLNQLILINFNFYKKCKFNKKEVKK